MNAGHPSNLAATLPTATPASPVPRPAAARAEWLDPHARLTPAERRWLEDHFARALHHLGATGEVRVRVVDDAEMDAAHRQYSGVPGTTDVLTFDLRDEAAPGEPAQPLDTDLLVCVDEAARQAAHRGHDRARELLLYALHGTLHCLGEDDHAEDQAQRMHAREDRTLEAIGVGTTYAREQREGGPAC
jgi:probable rRNA maturation factor